MNTTKQNKSNKSKALKAVFALLLVLALAPIGFSEAQDTPETVTLTLAAYAVPREAYGDVIPAFQAYWLEQTGQTVIVQESYQASGAQSRAVASGFEADIVALSIESDVTRLVDAGLITHDWKAQYGGFVTDSVVVLAVREGNPFEIEDWDDLAQEDISVITPDPATSGGAQWNILGAYGAAKRGFVEGYEEGDEGATEFLSDLVENVEVFDRDGRQSFLTFESGVGDVAITYENEVYAGLDAGGFYEIVYPTSTILIENPIAVVDTYVDAHGTREVAEAFVQFVWTAEAQEIFVDHGFRPVVPEVAEALAEDEAFAEKYPEIEDLFTIEEFGGWGVVRAELFGEEGRFTALIADIAGEE